MRNILLVGLGGFVGSVLRYKTGGWVLHHTIDWKFPLSTFLVNVTGCLMAGLLYGLAEKHGALDARARLFIFTGVLGGFTTFSAFGLETITLLEQGYAGMALSYAGASVVVGLSALWLALK